MSWFNRKDVPISVAPIAEPVKVELTPMQRACHIAQDAGDVLMACERRLAPDDVLLAMCQEFEADHAPSYNSIFADAMRYSFIGSLHISRVAVKPKPAYVSRTRDLSLNAVAAERQRIELRIAQSNLANAQQAVKDATKRATTKRKAK
jgi:hypothetical protein